MLERIIIKNLALIKDAEIEFSDKLNIFSGETGAGKSIIVDALMLLMGMRYDKTMLSYGEDSGYVEGVFSVGEDQFDDYLEDGLMILTRKFNQSGKNEIKINGRTVTLSTLKEISSKLIDICGQNEYQFLSKKAEHMSILDRYIGVEISSLLASIESEYASYKKIKREIDSIGDESERLRKIDILQYNINEITSLNIYDGEEQELDDIKKKAKYSEKIKVSLDSAVQIFDGEGGINSALSSALRSLAQISSIANQYQNLHDRLSQVEIELDDITATVSEELADCDFDEELLEQTENRLMAIRNLRRKYGNDADFSKIVDDYQSELDVLEHSADHYEKLVIIKDKSIAKLYELSEIASNVRKKYAVMYQDEIMSELATLGMSKSQFVVNFEPICDAASAEKFISKNGLDNVEFYLSPNIGQPLMPLVKIISGGEMSRFMLAIKVVLSKLQNMQTMIFDEIDTGISGTIGQEVAKKLAIISRNCQIMCVSHLAQIASMADTHYYISKSDDNITTKTNISLLDREGMVAELSRLSGGMGITKMAEQNAEELKSWSDAFKNNL